MLFQRNVLPGTEPYLGGMPPLWPRHARAEAVARGEGPGNKEGMVQSFAFCNIAASLITQSNRIF